MLRNDNHWFSINVQGVCTPQLQFPILLHFGKVPLKIIGFDWPHHCALRGDHDGLLLGDSASPTWAKVRTRALVECVWWSRFQSLRIRFDSRQKDAASSHYHRRSSWLPERARMPTPSNTAPSVPTNHSQGPAYRDVSRRNATFCFNTHFHTSWSNDCILYLCPLYERVTWQDVTLFNSLQKYWNKRWKWVSRSQQHRFTSLWTL